MFKFCTKFFLCIILSPFFDAHSMEKDMEKNKDHNEKVLTPIIEHAKSIAQEKDGKGPNFIAIAGCMGVGKSYLADELARLLEKEGVKVTILKLDDFLNPDHFDPHHFHPRLEQFLAHSVIQKIKQGEKTVKKPAWNPKHLRPPTKIEENFSVKEADLILLEGEFALCNDESYNFRSYSKFSIFIDAEDKDIIEWDWQRAREIPEKTKEEYIKNQTPHLKKYRDYVSASLSDASYLLLKDINHRYTLQARSISPLKINS